MPFHNNIIPAGYPFQATTSGQINGPAFIHKGGYLTWGLASNGGDGTGVYLLQFLAPDGITWLSIQNVNGVSTSVAANQFSSYPMFPGTYRVVFYSGTAPNNLVYLGTSYDS